MVIAQLYVDRESYGTVVMVFMSHRTLKRFVWFAYMNLLFHSIILHNHSHITATESHGSPTQKQSKYGMR